MVEKKDEKKLNIKCDRTLQLGRNVQKLNYKFTKKFIYNKFKKRKCMC